AMAVHPDTRLVTVVARLDADAVADCSVEEFRHAADKPAGLRRAWQKGLGTGESEQAAGERRGARGAFRSAVEVASDVGMATGETALGELDPAHHNGKHIVEIVGDTAGQLAHGIQLLDLAEAGL